MTILSFPQLSRTPSGASYRLRGNTQTHRSPFDGSLQTIEMPGAVWEFTVTWNSLIEADWRNLGTFLAQLRGRAGRFYFSPATFAPRRGNATTPGTQIFFNAPIAGTSFITEGWNPSSGVGSARGDWMAFTDATGRNRLHIAVQDFSVNSSGLCSHLFTPPLRGAPVLGAPLEVAAPAGVFMLTDDAPDPVEIRPPRLGSYTLTMVEALA